MAGNTGELVAKHWNAPGKPMDLTKQTPREVGQWEFQQGPSQELSEYLTEAIPNEVRANSQWVNEKALDRDTATQAKLASLETKLDALIERLGVVAGGE